jgi:diguanylate cyclase (GGDEF)-like protein
MAFPEDSERQSFRASARNALTFSRAFLIAFLLLALAAGGVRAESASRLDLREAERNVSYDPPQTVKLALESLHAAQSTGDKEAQLVNWRILAMGHIVMGDTQALNVDTERGMALAQELGDKEAICQFLGARAIVERNADHPSTALALFDQALELAERHHFYRLRARLYVHKAVLLIRMGRNPEALPLLANAHSQFVSLAEPYGMAWALENFGDAYNVEGGSATDRAKSIDYYLRAIESLDTKVYRAKAGDIYHNLGLAYFRGGDYVLARRYYEMGRAITKDLEDAFGSAFFEYRLAILAKQQDRNAEALARIDRALPAFIDRGRSTMVFLAHLARAEALAGLGRGRESQEALAAARALLPRLAAAKREVSYFDRAAAVYARQGLYEQAFREMGQLRDAEQRHADEANAKLVAELQTRFDVQRRDTENAVLVAQHQESRARYLALGLALTVTLVLGGTLVALVVMQARQRKQFARLAMRDELTGIPNRRAILEFGQLQFDARHAFDTGFGIAIIDIDHFKTVNDVFGHAIGDAVLTAFARVCQKNLRVNDRLGRIGGEEFLIVMPGSDLTQIPFVFGRLRDAMSSIKVNGFAAPRPITFSLGTSQAEGDGDSFDALMKRADRALYRAKGAGRDRYEIARR